jgi:hypothetical protein
MTTRSLASPTRTTGPSANDPVPPQGAGRYASAFIPGLEALQPGLGTIPGIDTRDPRHKEPDAESRLAWFDWRARAAPIRAQVLLATAGADGARARQVQREFCRRDWSYFTTMFGWTFDPRLRSGEGTHKPFFPFAVQANKIQEVQRLLAAPGKIDTFDSKARGFGWTETYVEANIGAWVFTDAQLHWVSYKEEKVYKRNDKSTIFGKIEYKIQRLPEWFLPAGFVVEDHMLRLNLYNPETGASITGETTTTRTARGDRKLAIFYDEAAFVEGGFLNVYGVGAGTTDKRFVFSTESWDNGTDWETLWQDEQKHGDPQRVWIIDWWHNPYQDTVWYAEEKNRWKSDPHGFAREYERNPEAAATSLIYPEAKLCRLTPEHHDPAKTLLISIDPGHADDTAISWGQPIRGASGQGIRWLGNYKRNRVPVATYAHLLTGIPPEEGDVCWNMWLAGQFSERERRLMAWFYERHAMAAEHREFVRLCMDPAGNQQHAGVSWYDQFYTTTQELRVRDWEKNGHKGLKPKGLMPNFEFLKDQGNFHVDRIACTRTLLPNSEFSTADPAFWQAEDIQADLRRSSYSVGTVKSVSQPKPLHDDTSHTRYTVEAASVFSIMGMIDPPKRLARKMLDAVGRQSGSAASQAT